MNMFMKQKLIFLLMAAALTLVAVSVKAQEGYDDSKYEISVGIGAYTYSHIKFGKDYSIDLSDAYLIDDGYNRAFSGECYYRLKPSLGVGGVFVYTDSEDVYYMKDTPIKVGVKNTRCFTLMPAVKYDWFRRKYFGMYSKLALGASICRKRYRYSVPVFDNESHHEFLLNFQATFIGFEFGGSHFRGYYEMGGGEQGFMVMGLRLKL
jgi:hypothetical protein